MEQRIQFCPTADGITLAYTIVGRGYPLVRVVGGLTHLEYEWQSPIWRETIEGLARDFELIRYDGRGMGLSDRGLMTHDVDKWALDAEAVIETTGRERVALLGISQGGSAAITYAVRHPERVSHLVLYGAFAQSPLPVEDEEYRALVESLVTMIKRGWGGNQAPFRQVFTSMYVPGASAEQMRWYDDLQYHSTSPENGAALLEAIARVDVRDLLPRVAVPTLVLHRRGDRVTPFELGRRLAAAIRGSRFVPLEGDNHLFLDGEPELRTFFGAIRDFVGSGQPPDAALSPSGQRGDPTALFTTQAPATLVREAAGQLTSREIDVLRLLASGKTNKEIAADLVLSVHTIERHVANIYAKIGARGRAEAVAFALTHPLA